MAEQPAEFGKEVEAGVAPDELPAYAEMLAAYHRSAAGELQTIINDLPLQATDYVLDVACGDGVYSAWLAERVTRGQVVGVDLSPAYLDVAQRHAQERGVAERISFRRGDIARLPFPDDTFDLAWCAHSLYSLPDPLAALREMRRVVRNGGTVVVLENDTLHHLLLPWPADLELAVRKAQLTALEQDAELAGKFFIGRYLCQAFELAELAACTARTYTLDRRAPLDQDEQTYVAGYLRDLVERARPYLDPAARAAVDMLLDPQSRLYLLNQPGFFMTHLEIVAQGIKQA